MTAQCLFSGESRRCRFDVSFASGKGLGGSSLVRVWYILFLESSRFVDQYNAIQPVSRDPPILYVPSDLALEQTRKNMTASSHCPYVVAETQLAPVWEDRFLNQGWNWEAMLRHFKKVFDSSVLRMEMLMTFIV